jgi:hypothetical protein
VTSAVSPAHALNVGPRPRDGGGTDCFRITACACSDVTARTATEPAYSPQAQDVAVAVKNTATR